MNLNYSIIKGRTCVKISLLIWVEIRIYVVWFTCYFQVLVLLLVPTSLEVICYWYAVGVSTAVAIVTFVWACVIDPVVFVIIGPCNCPVNNTFVVQVR